LQTGRWYHIAATLDNTSHVQTLYVNGGLAARATVTGLPLVLAGPYRPTIGSYTSGSYFYGFQGIIDEVRLSVIVRLPWQFDLQLPPTNLGTYQSGFAANLRWWNGGGAVALQKYRIYRGLDSINVSLIDSTWGSTTYADTTVIDGLTYYYRVSAVDVTGFEGLQSAAAPISIHTPPGQLSLIYPANGATTSSTVMRFLWRASPAQPDRYWFELARDSLFALTSIDSTLPDTSTVVQGLRYGGRFWWRVRAHSSAGWGQFSEVNTFWVVVESADRPSPLPRELNLLQNYPNPFNPCTTIGYELPRLSFVNLAMFDALGRTVAVLVNQEQPAGRYESRFDGTHLASGTYFYRLRAEGRQISKKLYLLK